MRMGRFLKNLLHPGAGPAGWRRKAAVGLGLGGLVLAVAVLSPWLGGAILNGYGKGRVERAFAKAHPGCVLRIGALAYTLRTDHLVARTVTLETPEATLGVARVTLAGVRWGRLLLGRSDPVKVFAQASLEATGCSVVFTRAGYGLHVARLSATVPGSELVVEGTELRPLLGDQAFFAARAFRTTRFHVVVPECRILGLALAEAMQAGALRARELQVLHPSFDALVDRDKPVRSSRSRPLMVGEALAAIRPPLQLDLLRISDGQVHYGERVVAGAAPGVLTFTTVDLRATGITNRGGAPAIGLAAQCRLMDAGVLGLRMTIPLAGGDRLRYSGTLGAMDLTRLNAFLERSEHLRITSGHADRVAFQVRIKAGQARGQVRARYRDLKLAVLDPATGTEKGLRNRMVSFLMNTFKVRHGNGQMAGAAKRGRVDYRRKPDDAFMQVVWFALRSGLLDIVMTK